MIIVAGHLRVEPAHRDAFIARSCEAMRIARETVGCFDFVVAPDPLDDGRVDVYERWVDRKSLVAFRSDGPSAELRGMIQSFEVEEFEVPDIQSTRELMRTFNDAFQLHQPQRLAPLVAEDCKIENTDGSVHRGKAACLALWTRIATEVNFVLEDTIVSGESAMIFWRIEDGPRGINAMRVRDGLIVEALGYVKSS